MPRELLNIFFKLEGAPWKTTAGIGNDDPFKPIGDNWGETHRLIPVARKAFATPGFNIFYLNRKRSTNDQGLLWNKFPLLPCKDLWSPPIRWIDSCRRLEILSKHLSTSCLCPLLRFLQLRACASLLPSLLQTMKYFFHWMFTCGFNKDGCAHCCRALERTNGLFWPADSKNKLYQTFGALAL